VLGVNAVMRALRDERTRDGRLGVFWHTQGSGKSLSMLFFTQKVLRREPGNWTFVMVTDRAELDDQLYGDFKDAGAVEGHLQATSSAHLRRLLGEDHRYVFTLIHKFRPEGGNEMPVCSERDDVIVITDEAHRRGGGGGVCLGSLAAGECAWVAVAGESAGALRHRLSPSVAGPGRSPRRPRRTAWPCRGRPSPA
jgi:hypothetical protein